MRMKCLAGGVALVWVAATGCNVKKAENLTPSGPSELGLSLTIQALPDVLTMDGASQAQIVIEARNANGQPVANLTLRIETLVGGTVADVGTLSSKSATTGGDGRAQVTYTAPTSPPSGNSDSGADIVTVQVTPIGSNFANALPRRVDIRLVPRGVVLPPNGSPVPSFTFSPTSPNERDSVSFDASQSTDDGVITSYRWDFGDRRTATGVRTNHRYDLRGEYVVTLTVTDDRGLSASTTQNLTVGASDDPVAAFEYSPKAPGPGTTVFFNGSASSASPGRVIVAYNWTMGNGRSRSGMNVSETYTQQGDYAVVLTVRDDAGKSGTTSQVVSVGTGLAPTADFSISPTAPTVGTAVVFNGTLSKAPGGLTITKWAWDFGDGSTGSGSTVTHAYTAPGTYTVVLTVTDSKGGTATRTRTVSVS